MRRVFFCFAPRSTKTHQAKGGAARSECFLSVSASVNLTVPLLAGFQVQGFQDGFHRIGHFVMVTKARLPDWVTNEISTLLVLVDRPVDTKSAVSAGTQSAGTQAGTHGIGPLAR